MEFVLTGYTSEPVGCIMQLYIDWQTRTVLEPFQMRLAFTGRQASGHLGSANAAAHIANRESYAYKQAMALCPKALTDFLFRDSAITLNEAVTLVRVSIQIEEKIDPDEISGQIHLVEVLPNGRELKASEGLTPRKRAVQTKTKN